MNETVISIDKLCKKYCRDLKHSMLYGIQDLALEIFGVEKKNQKLRNDEFWALNGISIELKKGDVLGILGANGSGKSTLLKLISGIFYPDSGTVKTQGKVGELIEVGAGFHPMLTGKENIYVKGAILGLTKKEIDSKFDEIVEFSELDEFINTPVKYYSTGMHMRLGFSIIAYSNPDILLIDEVLSVGDVNFRAKCFNKITDLIASSGVVFVSHNMADVARICTSVMVLNRGECKYYDQNVLQGINCYYEESCFDESPSVSGSGKAELKSIDIRSGYNINSMTVQNQLDDLIIEILFNIDNDISRVEIVVTIINLEQQNIIQSNSHFDDIILDNDLEDLRLMVNMGSICLNPGVYGITLSFHREGRGEILAKFSNCLQFRIKGDRLGHAQLQTPAQWKLN